MGHTTNYISFVESIKNRCPSCESQNVKERWESEEFQYGLEGSAAQLSALIPVCTCMECDFEYTDERAERIRHATVCQHLGILPPEQVVAIRERYGKSQQEFAEVTRVGRASLARWETGSIFQNGSIDSLLYLLGFPENMDRLVNRVSQTELNRKSQDAPIMRRFRCIAAEEEVVLRQESFTFQLFSTQ